jgi:CysZ protein
MEKSMASGNRLFKKAEIRTSLYRGFINSFRTFSLLRENRSMLIYFVVPFILNILILSGIFYYSYTTLIPMLQSFLSGDAWYMQFLRILVSPVLFILFSIFTILIYSIAGGIITAPFLDLLSFKTERVLGNKSPEESVSIGEMVSDILRALSNSIRLILLIILINIVLLLLNLIPGGSFIYAFLNFLSALFFYGFQFYDFPLERDRYSFNEKLRITWRFKGSVFGTGLAFFLMSFIPVIGFLGLNFCTVGAAVTYTEDIDPVLTGD